MARIILFRGKAGVGKTTISNVLSSHLKLTVIHKDAIYDGIADTIKEHQIRNEICDKILKNIIESCIENNTDVIIDSSYHYLNQIMDFKEWVEFKGGQLNSILLVCSDEELWKNRFERRKLNPKPNNIIVDFEALKKHYKTLKTETIADELVIDTINQIEKLVKHIIQWLKVSRID